MAGDPRSDHEPEFVDNVAGEQRLRHRDARMDADVASALLPELPNNFDQVTVEQAAIADEMISTLMGDDVESRKQFITTNAREVRNLDF